MGQSESSERAIDQTSHGVITFSDDVLKKMSEEVESEPEPERNILDGISNDMTDKEWFEKLKEIDDNHSNVSGISVETFNNLIERIDYKINDIDLKVPYAHDMLMETLKSDTNRSLYTSPVVQNYIECADIYQRRMLNRRLFEKRLEESQRKRNKRRFIF